jgi:hypothetical protein
VQKFHRLVGGGSEEILHLAIGAGDRTRCVHVGCTPFGMTVTFDPGTISCETIRPGRLTHTDDPGGSTQTLEQTMCQRTRHYRPAVRPG